MDFLSSLGRATLQEWALIFYGTTESPYGNDVTNPIPASNPPHANPSASQTVQSQGKGRQSRPRPAPSVFSSPYAVNSPPRKGKNRPHKNNAGKPSSHHSLTSNTARPSAIEIRRPTMPTASRPRGRQNSKTTLPRTNPTIAEITTSSPVTKSSTISLTSVAYSVTTVVNNFSSQLEPTTKLPPQREYPIVKQLFPLYALSKLEGLSSGKGRMDSSSFLDSRVNLAPSSGHDLRRPDSHHPGLIKGISL